MTPADLRAWRETAGLDQGRLAARLGVTRLSVWRWEHGRRRVPRHLEVLLEHFAELEPPDWWLERKVKPANVDDGWPPTEPLPRRAKGAHRAWWPTSRARPLSDDQPPVSIDQAPPPADHPLLERRAEGWCVVQAGQVLISFGPGAAGHQAATDYCSHTE